MARPKGSTNKGSTNPQMFAMDVRKATGEGLKSFEINVGNAVIRFDGNGMVVYSKRATKLVVNGVDMLAPAEEPEPEPEPAVNGGEGTTEPAAKHSKKG